MTSYYFVNSFNSRPHKEVDIIPVLVLHGIQVFQLTTSQGGRLSVLSCHSPGIHLSTHDLTRRSTRVCHFMYFRIRTFNSRPHKEVDHTSTLMSLERAIFQLTTSQGGRHFSEGRTRLFATFQLTTSQGGRLMLLCIEILSKYSFNSRPHKEVDCSKLKR